MNADLDVTAAATASGQPSIPTTTTAVTARTYGTEEVLGIEQIPVPTPGDGEVLIQVVASSLNALDWHFVTGTPYFLRLMAGLTRPNRHRARADLTVLPWVSDVASGATGSTARPTEAAAVSTSLQRRRLSPTSRPR